MFDSRLKNLHLIYIFSGYEEGMNIFEEYDIWPLYPMLLKCYHYLHSIVESKVRCANQINNANFNLDIF
jgi:hypothetical protein